MQGFYSRLMFQSFGEFGLGVFDSGFGLSGFHGVGLASSMLLLDTFMRGNMAYVSVIRRKVRMRWCGHKSSSGSRTLKSDFVEPNPAQTPRPFNPIRTRGSLGTRATKTSSSPIICRPVMECPNLLIQVFGASGLDCYALLCQNGCCTAIKAHFQEN